MGDTSPLTIEGENILFQKPEQIDEICGLRLKEVLNHESRNQNQNQRVKK
jgi:hypothetical protein